MNVHDCVCINTHTMPAINYRSCTHCHYYLHHSYSANPIGLAVVQIVSPYIVSNAGDIERMVSLLSSLPFSVSIVSLPPVLLCMLCVHFYYLSFSLLFQRSFLLTSSLVCFTHYFMLQLWLYAIPAGVTFVVTVIAFWYKEPQIPPAPCGERDHVPSFWRGILDVSYNIA